LRSRALFPEAKRPNSDIFRTGAREISGDDRRRACVEEEDWPEHESGARIGLRARWKRAEQWANDVIKPLVNLKIEPIVYRAPRATIDAIAADPARRNSYWLPWRAACWGYNSPAVFSQHARRMRFLIHHPLKLSNAA